MKYFLLLLISIGSVLSAYSQPDSTQIRLNAYLKEDTVKVEMLIDACINATYKSDTRVLHWATQARTLAEKLNYALGSIRAINCIGNYYFEKGLFDKAMLYYTESLKLAEARNDARNIIISKSNVANVFTHMRKPQQAIQLFKECDALLMVGKDSLSQHRAAILTNLATAYSKIPKHDSAIHFYKKVYHISKKLSIGFGIAISQSNLANEYYAIKHYPEALEALKEAEQMVKKMSLSFLEATLYASFGKVYAALGDTEKGIDYLTKGADMAMVNKNLNSLYLIYKTQQEIYAHAGDYKNAYKTSLLFIQVNDSLMSVEKDKTVTELNIQYETEKKEARIAALQQEKSISELTSERKTLLLYIIVAAALLVTVVAYFIFTRYKYQQEKQLLTARVTYEQDLNKSILKSIKAQMNPHFFYNALNTIQSYIFTDDKRNASTYLNKFSNLTRMILEMSEKERVLLTQEVKLLTLYLELEQSRFNDNFTFTFEVDAAIDQEMISIPPMLIQPYVENAIKHGLLHKQGERTVSIRITREHKYLTIMIDDNGIGRKESAHINQSRKDKPASFATSANQTRLDILNQSKSNKLGVQYIDKQHANQTPAGTTVIITIPLSYE